MVYPLTLISSRLWPMRETVQLIPICRLTDAHPHTRIYSKKEMERDRHTETGRRLYVLEIAARPIVWTDAIYLSGTAINMNTVLRNPSLSSVWGHNYCMGRQQLLGGTGTGITRVFFNTNHHMIVWSFGVSYYTQNIMFWNKKMKVHKSLSYLK